MGKATAAALAQKGATVILIARDQRKGETVRDAIRTQSGNKNLMLRRTGVKSGYG